MSDGDRSAYRRLVTVSGSPTAVSGGLEPRLLDLPAAAHYLGMTVPALRTMIQRRQIPFVRVGKRAIRFDLRRIDAWILERTTPAVEPGRRRPPVACPRRVRERRSSGRDEME